MRTLLAQTNTVGGAHLDDDILAHAPDSHAYSEFTFGFFRRFFCPLADLVFP
jgi:hypothetical protein